ncbi:MAG: hypothetical protein LQ340_001310 [Diploschistes diacapsis]|nr:MAG: hypothetical protein LQ340_001310 [Diploschistes diacapsis]
MPAPLSFRTAVITGGAGGIGLRLATWLQSLGKKVIIVGRTESKLRTASAETLRSCPYYVLDTSHIASIAPFVDRLLAEHPDTDCLINNAGVQRPLYFSLSSSSGSDSNTVIKKSCTFDLPAADAEIDTNIRGPMHLTVHLLPHLATKPSGTIVNVSSVLGFVPFSVINPVYNGTKAWLHFHTLNMRTQLRREAPNVTVIEIAPPAVGTDLHREREDPDDNKEGRNGSLTLEQFMEDVVPQWERGETFITAGMGHQVAAMWYEGMGERYRGADEAYAK